MPASASRHWRSVEKWACEHSTRGTELTTWALLAKRHWWNAFTRNVLLMCQRFFWRWSSLRRNSKTHAACFRIGFRLPWRTSTTVRFRRFRHCKNRMLTNDRNGPVFFFFRDVIGGCTDAVANLLNFWEGTAECWGWEEVLQTSPQHSARACARTEQLVLRVPSLLFFERINAWYQRKWMEKFQPDDKEAVVTQAEDRIKLAVQKMLMRDGRIQDHYEH